MTVPPYYPDSPMVRKILARYHDLITLMDRRVGEILAELEADNLADETIVFFYSDHGCGIPRHKRVLYDTGLNVPFILRVPPKYAHLAPTRPGRTTERLISAVDLAPTMLGLVGLAIPGYMQGAPFLGPATAKPRANMSRRIEPRRRSLRHVSLRPRRPLQIYPQLPAASAPHSAAPTATRPRSCRNSVACCRRRPHRAQAALWNKRPAEELYDTQSDPLELNNLIDSPRHAKIKARLKAELHRWMLDIKDAGLLSEAAMHRRSKGSTPYELTRQPDFPIERILAAADNVGLTCDKSALLRLLKDPDPAVRFWGVIAAANCQPAAALIDMLKSLLTDADPNVRFAAAGLLVQWTDSPEALDALIKGLDHPDGPTALYAAREIELAGKRPRLSSKGQAARQANFASERHRDIRCSSTGPDRVLSVPVECKPIT